MPGVTSNGGGSAARQAALRDRKRKAGLVPATVWIPAAERPALIQLAERLAADPDLTCGPLRRISTGRLERV